MRRQRILKSLKRLYSRGAIIQDDFIIVLADITEGEVQEIVGE